MKVPTKQEIEQRAYEFYLARGCEPGMDLEDWLAAEKDLAIERIVTESEIEEAREPAIEGRRLPRRNTAMPVNPPVTAT